MTYSMAGQSHQIDGGVYGDEWGAKWGGERLEKDNF
jgi:hypothetical protein